MIGNLGKYLEMTKPKVTLLNLFVGAVCFVLATFPTIEVSRLLVFIIAGYMTAGGCGVLNCVYDCNLDKLMTRTSARAIPAGFVTPRNALIFGSVMTVAGFTFSYFALNGLTALMMVLGAFFYVFVYTIVLKRASSWNVVIGGFAGCFAALSGWTAAVNGVSLLPLLVSALDFLWTPGHLWGLAIRKVTEYSKARIPMLPVAVGIPRASQIVLLFNALTVVSSLLLPLFCLAGLSYAVIAALAGAWFLFENGRLIAFPSETRGFRVFLASMSYLAIIMTGLILDKILFWA